MILSIVTPCYNEEDNIVNFFYEIKSIKKELPKNVKIEIIYVDDGSSDNTYEKILELSKKYDYVKYISFSRNFGKEAAMFAGLESAIGDYVVIMDVDLQDPPSLIPKMYSLISTGEYDRIATRRTDRKGEPIIRSFFAKAFYKLVNKVSDVKIVSGARDFSMLSRKFVNSILLLNERSRFTKGMFEWAGFRTYWLSFNNHERSEGKSKWSFFKLFCYSIEGIISLSNVPLIISSIIGIILCLFSFFMIVVVIVKKVFFGDPVDGWSSLVCIILFVSGLQQMCIGVLGSYLSKVFVETKNRPLYVVMESNIEEVSNYGLNRSK